MTTETDLPSEGEAVSYPVDDNSPMTVEEAARDLGSAREKAFKSPAESAEEATAETELSDEDNAAPEEGHGEDEEAEAVAEPPIERPKSWSKEEDAEWQSLPRAMQQKIVARELERDTGTNRKLNEVAEKLKGLTAKEQEADKVRQQYEADIKAARDVLLREQARDFPDLRTMEDVENLAREAQRLWETDPFAAGPLMARFNAWQAHQQNLIAINAKAQQAEQSQKQKHQTDWQEFRQKEGARATELIPELADEKKGPVLMAKAAKLLRDVNFSQDELSALDAGEKISPFDHRMQSIIADAVKYRDIISAKTAVAAKPVPPVQRPGTAKPASSGVTAQIQALERQLSSATGDRAARISADIWQLEKKSARR